MRVALVHQGWNDPTPPVRSGSIAIWIDRVAPWLAAAECEVVVYGPSQSGRDETEERGGVLYRRVPIGLDRRRLRWLRRLPRRNPRLPFYTSRWHFGTYARRVARDAARRGCDIVHLHNFAQHVGRHRAAGAAVVLHMHCEWLAQLERRWVEREVRGAQLVLGCSDYVTGRARAALPALAARCRTIYNGVDAELFAPAGLGAAPRREAQRSDAEPTGQEPGDAGGASGDGPQLLFVGRRSPEKGLHVLVAAFASLLPRFPGARLTVVGPAAAAPREFTWFPGGDERLRRALERYPDRYAERCLAGLAPAQRARVEVLDAVDHAALPQLYRAAAVAVVPSVWPEPFGMPIVEAMACGTPVVASRVGGIPEILGDQRGGLLVPPDDPAALAAALAGLLEDPRRRAAMGAAARDIAATRFSWQQVAADLLGYYRELRPWRGSARGERGGQGGGE